MGSFGRKQSRYLMSHFVHSNFFSVKTLSPVGVLIENKMVTTNYTAQTIMCWPLN